MPTSELLPHREAEDDELLQLHQGVIDRVLHDQERGKLTQDRAQQLRFAVHFLEGFADRYANDPRPKQRMQVIVAHRLLGLAKLLLRDYPRAEAAFRESLRLADAAAADNQQPEVQVLQALNEGSLGWLLAMTGRLDEAESITKSSIHTWEELTRVFPDRASLNTGLAVYRRNLAMIREAGQGDGRSDATQSVGSASLALAKTASTFSQVVGSEAGILHVDTLIDSEQVLGMLHWRRGHQSQAEAVCRSSISRLQEMLRTIASTYEINRYVATTARSEKYRQALARAHDNLSLLVDSHDANQDVRVDEIASRPVNDWQWKLLNSRPGETLPMELLIRGNRFPGEFEPQDALLLSWQYEWADDPMRAIILAVHKAIPIVLLVDHAAQQQEAVRHLKDVGVSLDRIEFLHRPTESPWVRDFGPLSVRSSSSVPLWLDPVYPFTVGMRRFDDDHLPQVLAESQQVNIAALPYLIEGGGILSNGAGICLVTSYLKDRNQQFGVSESQLSAAIRQYLGAEQVVYLEPLSDEPTRHLDWFCAFTADDTVVVGEYGPEDRANRELLDRHARRLAELDTPGGKLKVVRIPMPPRGEGYFGGTYTNVIFANGVLVVPTWPEASPEVEKQALEVYQRLLPGWTIAPVPSRRFGYRAGGPHCCSMNLLLGRRPQGVDRPDREN